MDTRILKQALHMMLQRGDNDPDVTSGIQDALEEIANVEELWGDDAVNWDYDVTPLPISGAIDLVNRCLYDDYGLLRRANTTAIDYGDFAYDARTGGNSYGFEYMSDKALEAGFEFIRDLWQDNENVGDNNLDGSFRK